jgi:outer membrane protein assembly factor BamB
LWNTSPNIGSLSGIPLIVNDGSIYLITDDGILYSLSTANGQQSWAYQNGLVFIGAADDSLYAIRA